MLGTKGPIPREPCKALTFRLIYKTFSQMSSGNPGHTIEKFRKADRPRAISRQHSEKRWRRRRVSRYRATRMSRPGGAAARSGAPESGTAARACGAEPLWLRHCLSFFRVLSPSGSSAAGLSSPFFCLLVSNPPVGKYCDYARLMGTVKRPEDTEPCRARWRSAA